MPGSRVMATKYSPGQVAELLGVSPDTVRRWCDEGRLGPQRGGGATRVIKGSDLAKLLEDNPVAYEPDSVFAQSARNRFTGIVTKVQRDKLTAVVELRAGPHRVVSTMTREAVDDLGLEPGDLAVAAVKASFVLIEVPS